MGGLGGCLVGRLVSKATQTFQLLQALTRTLTQLPEPNKHKLCPQNSLSPNRAPHALYFVQTHTRTQSACVRASQKASPPLKRRAAGRGAIDPQRAHVV